MATDLIPEAGLSAGERKKLLIAQGRLYRLGVIESRQEIASSLRMDSLAKAAVGHLTTNGYAALGQALNLTGGPAAQLKFLLPLLVSGASLLARNRHRARPSWRSIAGLGAAAAAAFLAFRWNQVKARRDRA
jgi:hypothetical protein